MEKLVADLNAQIQFLNFRRTKTKGIVEKGNAEGIERHRDALRTIMKTVEDKKLQIEQAKFVNGEAPKDVAAWSSEIEEQQAAVDEEISDLTNQLNEVNLRTTLEAKKCEDDRADQAREKQLQFEKAQLELKLDYERKIEEAKRSNVSGSPSPVKTAKLPKLVITKFGGTLTDWPRFWNQFEAEIDRSEVAGVTKFSYLKELVEPNVRTLIDGLPFSTEGYERAKTILKTKYGKKSEIVNAYVQNIMALPTIAGSRPAKIHDFYEKLVFNVQSLESLGKLREVNGYVRMSIDKLEGIRGDLVRTDDSWQEWDFPKFVDALRKWTERNPIAKHERHERPRDKEKPYQRDRSYQTQQKEEKMRGCVYCDKPDHRSTDCKTVSTLEERKRSLSNKRLCFNCTGSKHRAADCRSRLVCQCCQRKHHTSICDRLSEQLLTAASAGNSAVIHPVVVVAVQGVKCRALLDTGAGSSYASAALLDIQPHQREVRQIEMMLGTVTKNVEIFKVQVSSMKGDFSLVTEVTKVDKRQLLALNNPRYQQCLARYDHLKGIQMEDTDTKDTLPVHLILGASDYAKIKTETAPRMGALGEPIGEKTKLGWTIMSPGKEVDLSTMFFTQTSSADYERLCRLDVLGLADSSVGDQQEVYAEFKEQLRRDSTGWYETGLPWRGNHPPLGNNESGSLRRLSTLVRKLKNQEIIERYDKVIREQIDEGIVERITGPSKGREFYIPHKAVVREASESTKLRVVYDASARANKGTPSLNECLNPGPPLQNQLWAVLVRCRFHPVAIAGDIKQAFLQVRIREEDRDALRFHWLKDLTTETVETLRFTRALFGLTSSPFLLGGVIQHLLESCRSTYPVIVEELRRSLYVDDLISGGPTIEKAQELKSTAIEIFAQGTFELHKWHSNDPQLDSPDPRPVVGDEETYAKEQLGIQRKGGTFILGLSWDKDSDTIGVTFSSEKAEATKRGILGKIARIYDPLGLVSPVTLRGKLLYRDACEAKVAWDAQLPNKLTQDWLRWVEKLPDVCTVPRSLATQREEIQSIQLHAFGDASGKGVAAAVYAVVVQESSTNQGLVAAKARLAKQGLTIPRQELVSGHMAVNLVTNVSEALEGFPVTEKYCWLDSTVALHWIKGPGEYKQFVSNRVNKIQAHRDVLWRHVGTSENPADLGSRGGDVAHQTLWWHGPKWLSNKEQWPLDIITSPSKESIAEVKATREIFAVVVAVTDELDDVLEKYPYWKAIKVCARVLRFLHNVRSAKTSRWTGPLTTEEMNRVKRFWVKRVQARATADERYREDQLQLNLQPNAEGILECRGRIQGHYPVYLPDRHRYTEKLVAHAHLGALHGGVGSTMTKVREHYWVPRLRRLAKKIIKSCHGCQRFRAQAFSCPPPGNLPRNRTEGRMPFQVVGVDYAGPLKYCKKAKAEGKAYVLLYACSLTRALFLDLLPNLETTEFLGSLKRFIARRGRPERIYSDNGRTFLGASNWIKQVMHDEKFHDLMARQGIHWQFNLSRAPWWGGQFERMVGLVKSALNKSIGNGFLSWGELQEVLLDVEVSLNNRPLSYIEDDVEMPILTPSSLLYLQPNALPELEPHNIEEYDLRKRAKYLRRCKDALWLRWTTEYLRGLRERHRLKHKGKPNHPVKGDVVIIKSEEKNRNEWKLGIVEDLITGRDGVVRGAKLRAGKSNMERAVQHLYPLELTCNSVNDTPTAPLNPRAPMFRPRRDAAIAAKCRIQDLAQDELRTL